MIDPRTLARGWPVWALALGQMLAYACMYYIFAALILAWQDDLGWPKTQLAQGPTLAIVISACLVPFLGRMVDRGFGPELMAGGAALGALALLWLAQVKDHTEWMIGWAMIGVAQAASLYEVCFAYLIRRLGREGRVAIIRVTLIAGLASTLAFPAGAALAHALGWRGAVWVASGVMAAVVLPLNIWGAWSIRRLGSPPVVTTAAADKAALWKALVRPAFWMLAATFSLMSLNHWMIVNFLVPVFVQQGASHGWAVLSAACVGPAQVAGRLVLMGFEEKISPATATKATITASIFATLFLWFAGVAPFMIFAYAVLQGAAIGIVTILRPVMIGDVLGSAGYGAIAGVIQIPSLLAGAVAPLIGAFMLSGPGLPALMALSVVLLLVSMAALTVLLRVR